MDIGSPERKPKPLSNLNAAGIAAQMGCVMFVIVLGALLAGIWLDRVFEFRGLFTILLILLSVPLTWSFIFWQVNRLKSQNLSGMQFDRGPRTFEEEEHRDDQ